MYNNLDISIYLIFEYSNIYIWHLAAVTQLGHFFGTFHDDCSTSSTRLEQWHCTNAWDWRCDAECDDALHNAHAKTGQRRGSPPDLEKSHLHQQMGRETNIIRQDWAFLSIFVNCSTTWQRGEGLMICFLHFLSFAYDPDFVCNCSTWWRKGRDFLPSFEI